MGEIYLQGSRTGKTQEVCLELGPFCSILEFPLPTQPPPPPPSDGVIRGAYTGAVHAYLTFFIYIAYFFRLEICHKPIVCPNVAQK